MIQVVIVGTSAYSRLLRRLVESVYNPHARSNGGEELSATAFFDMFREDGEAGVLDGLIVLDKSNLAEVINEKKIGAILLPEQPMLDIQYLIHWFRSIGIYQDSIYFSPRHVLEKKELSKEDIDDLLIPYIEASYLPYLEFHIEDSCNLNCRACEHYSPLVKQNPDSRMVFEDVKRDFLQLKKLIERVGRIRILGGEPLLNPDLPEYVAMVREVYPEADIFVVTNGLLLNRLSDETCSVMRETGATFMISYYPPLEGKLDDIKRRIEEKGVSVRVSPLIKEFTMRQNLHGKNDPKMEFEACFQSSCNNLYKGKIAACMLPFMTHYFNEAFDKELPQDGAIDLYEAGLTTSELKRRLEKPFMRCAFCGEPVPVKWQQADREGNLKDFVLCDQKKLLFITHQLSRTGAPIVFLDMIRIFRNEGHEITVISLLDGPLYKELEAMGIPVSIKDDFFHDREAFRPYAEGFDAVFCNTLITYQVIHVLNGSSTPVFWWIHEGEQYFEYFKTVLPDLSKLSGNIKILSVGHYVQDVIRRRYGIETGILHFGIKDSFKGGAGAKNSRVKEDRVRFVISGTYSKVKGQDILCAAIRDLPDEIRKRCEFIFCGNEENVDEEVFSAVEKLVRDHDNVKKYASLPREKMIEMMGTMDYLIVPSRVEPVSAVAAEAMMMQRPCIITDICGIAHYLKDKENALLCRAEDKKGLCEKITEAVRLSEDSIEYEKMAKAAREVYDKHFSDKVIKPKILSLLSEPGKREKLIFTVGVYDILDIFTYEMIPEFERLGYEIFLFDSSDMVHTLGKLYDFIKTPVKACITFNNLAFNTELTPGRNMWDDLGIPIINILMDHPFCHKKALDNAPKNAIVLCPDLNHMRYLERFYPGIATVGFLPHGGKLLHKEPKPIKERQIDIIYAGGISRKFAAKMMPDFNKYPYDAKDIADKAYDMMINDPSITTEEAIEIEVKKHGVVLSDDELCSLIEELHYVDLLIVSYYREKVIRTLAEAGFSIALYGTGWEVCDWMSDCPALDYRGRVSADEIVELMHEAKIVLSTMTWFKDGTHDRVYNGMLAGAVAVTDTSLYMKENYKYYPDNSAALVMFELSETDRLPALIKELLSDQGKMQTIADNGRKMALSKDTWAARANELHRDLLTQL